MGNCRHVSRAYRSCCAGRHPIDLTPNPTTPISVIGICILFLEVKWLFRCFRTPERFEQSVRKIEGNYPRFGAYLVASVPMFASAAFKVTSLIATGVILLVSALCFLAAALMHQDFAGSKTLGGGGADNMMII